MRSAHPSRQRLDTRNRRGAVRFGGQVRGLRNGTVELGRAVDSRTGESFPAQLVTAVPSGSDETPVEVIENGRPQWRIEQNRAIFAPFLQAAIDFMAKEPRSGGQLKNFLTALPAWLNFNDAVSKAFGAAKAPIKEFLDSFAEWIVWNKSLTEIRLKGGTRSDKQLRSRPSGKQAPVPTRSEPSAPSAEPVRGIPIAFERARAATRRN